MRPGESDAVRNEGHDDQDHQHLDRQEAFETPPWGSGAPGFRPSLRRLVLLHRRGVQSLVRGLVTLGCIPSHVDFPGITRAFRVLGVQDHPWKVYLTVKKKMGASDEPPTTVAKPGSKGKVTARRKCVRGPTGQFVKL